jgi:ATP-binding protein involved in chromosome partitioning
MNNENSASAPGRPHEHARPEPQPVPGVKSTLAVASGKGGVGKSSLSVNLAVALAGRGLRVGLMDTDIYGPNTPGMLGLAERPGVTEDGAALVPAEAFGLRMISMGLLLDRGTPVIWRGPMLAKMIGQFLFSVAWGELDLLVLDLPPGTGDVQITLTQSTPLTGAVIVTTPSEIALEDVRRGVAMFRQTNVPILGLIENMSSFVCDHCHQASAIFGDSHGAATAAAFNMPFLGDVPLDPALRHGADAGRPVVVDAPESPSAQAVQRIVGNLLAQMQDR